MFIGPIYFCSFSLLCAHFMANIHINAYRSHLLLHLFCNCARTLWQIFTSMFTGLIYFCSFSLLCAHIMANIPINAYRSHLLLHFFVIVCTPYGKYSHQRSQVSSTLAVFLCCVHTLLQIFTSMLIGPIYFSSFSLLCAHFMANILINVRKPPLLLQLIFAVGTPYAKYSRQF